MISLISPFLLPNGHRFHRQTLFVFACRHLVHLDQHPRSIHALLLLCLILQQTTGFVIVNVLGHKKNSDLYVKAHLDGFIAAIWLAAIVCACTLIVISFFYTGLIVGLHQFAIVAQTLVDWKRHHLQLGPVRFGCHSCSFNQDDCAWWLV